MTIYSIKWNKFVFFLHITTYDKDIYDQIRCSIALYWWTVQSRELELVAEVNTSWKQLKTMEEHVHSVSLSKNTINTHFKRHETRQRFSGVLSCINTKTRSSAGIYHPESSVCFVKQLKESLLNCLFICVELHVLVSVQETTPLNIRRVSRLLKGVFIVFFDWLSECTLSSAVFSSWWHRQWTPALRNAPFLMEILKNMGYDHKYP